MLSRSVLLHWRKSQIVTKQCIRTLFLVRGASPWINSLDRTVVRKIPIKNVNSILGGKKDSCGCEYSSVLQTYHLYSTSSQQNTDIKVPLDDPVKGRLVYNGILTSNVKRIKVFSFATSAMIIGMQVPLWLDPEKAEAVKSMFLLSIVGVFGFATPFMLHFVTKKYVMYMYFNENTKIFTATTLSLFLRKQDIQFKAEDVEIPTVPRMFTVLYAKGKPLFLDPTSYLEDEAYIHLMGYDKPLDLSLDQDDDDSNFINKEKELKKK